MKAITFTSLTIVAASMLFATADAHHGAWMFDVVPGSTIVDTSKLAPYSARWAQLGRKDGGLVDSGAVFEETLRRDGAVLRHTQTVSTSSGVVVVEQRVLDQRTLQALALERIMENSPPDRSSNASLKLEASTYTGQVVAGDGTEKAFSYAAPMPVFDGWIAGLVLASLPLETGYQVTLPAVVQLQRSTYQLHAVVQAKRVHEVAPGVTVPVWVVDTDWVNLADGSISPGGAENSGGTYYVAVQPGNGVPYVVEYANDGAVIRWIP